MQESHHITTPTVLLHLLLLIYFAKCFLGVAELTTQLLRLIGILWLPLCRINELGYSYPRRLLRSPTLVGHHCGVGIEAGGAAGLARGFGDGFACGGAAFFLCDRGEGFDRIHGGALTHVGAGGVARTRDGVLDHGPFILLGV